MTLGKDIPDATPSTAGAGPCPGNLDAGLILDGLPQGVFWKDLDGRYLGCNPAFARVLGRSGPEAVVGRTDFDLVGADAWAEACRTDDREVIATGRPKAPVLLPLVRPDGGRSWLEATRGPLRDRTGQVCGVLGSVQDVTGRRAAEEALRLSEDRLRMALEGANDGLWDVKMDTQEVYLSPRDCEILGYRPEDLPELARVWQELVHPEDMPLTLERLQAHLDGREGMFEVEQRLRTRGGGWKWVLTRGKVVERGAGGLPLRMAGTHTDLTARKAAEEELRHVTSRLYEAQKLESLGSLAGGLAHDLNNVLAAILGLAAMHREQLDADDPLGRSLDTIAAACMRGRDMVRSLLYFARRELQAFAPVDLNGICRELVKLLEGTTLKRVRVQLDLQEPLGLVDGDAGALGHALMNLAVNALDAMPGGGELAFRTRRLADGRAELAVADSGAGMDPDTMARAVEPFFTTKPVGKGTGLGLAMVYGAVQAHRGTLELQSEPGRGTRVFLRFPLLPAEAALEPAITAAAAPEPAGRGRILLVDDDELVRAALPPILARLGAEVRTAAGGPEALALLEAGLEVDLVILDVNMPGMDGAETLARLRVLRPEQKVLLATGYLDREVAALQGPGLGLLAKPFTLEELRAKVEELGALAGTL